MTTDSGARGISTYSFLVVFANDDTISAGELAMIKRLALKDGFVDEQERKAIADIFQRANMDTMPSDVRQEIIQFAKEHAIPIA